MDCTGRGEISSSSNELLLWVSGETGGLDEEKENTQLCIVQWCVNSVTYLKLLEEWNLVLGDTCPEFFLS